MEGTITQTVSAKGAMITALIAASAAAADNPFLGIWKLNPGRSKFTGTTTSTTKQDGNVIVTTTRSLSPDGKTMTVVSKGTKPNGEGFEDTSVLQRLSGQSGLIGKWRSKEVKVASPNTYSFEPNGEDGTTLKINDLNASCAAKFDGKDYPASGPTVPTNFTLALERKGPRSFEMTQKQNGKPLFRETFTVSADGKTMTSKGSAVGVNEQTTAVYDRQS